jgi:hypothetical protein
MYLLAQYFVNQASEADSVQLDGLTKIYKDLHIVNEAIAGRLQGVTQSDSLKNAIALVDMYSLLVPALMDNRLAELRVVFGAYLPVLAGELVTTKRLEEAKTYRSKPAPVEMEATEAQDEPDWPKDAAWRRGPEGLQVDKASGSLEDAEAVERERIIDDILGKSTLKLELVPMDDEEEGSSEPPADGATQHEQLFLRPGPKRQDNS